MGGGFLIFDIETRIDKALVRRTFFRGEALDDEVAYARLRQQLREESGSDFFPLSVHVPVSIALGTVDDNRVLVGVESLPTDGGEEGGVRRFWERIEDFRGVVVSFNGRGFDFPVLELRALHYGCPAPRYFNENRGVRHRFGEAHYDLYDFLTNYGASRLRGGMDLLAKLIDLPGKSGVDGSQVQALWEAGAVAAIDRYCRHDVIQTYFLFLRVELIRGRLAPDAYAAALTATAAFRAEIESA